MSDFSDWQSTWGSPIWREFHGYDRPLASHSSDPDFPIPRRQIEHSDDPRIAKGIMIFMAVGFVVISLAFFKVF
ncbi:hypothetical protein M2336_003562 [Sphingobium sp. B1D7B]|uniref:hypothetical protein n=1 Tax=Sphingobium sp. B1D7B TaxID=2940578 RepID=UPI00222579A6|nr:hypothetical protein [Sphingobium sp. B1D7B]MCW2406878.1 hypothetical protein [Sphingobium sp. B1D7B]